MLWQLDK